MNNADIVRRFEDEFKNKANHAIVDDLFAEGFTHHAPFDGLPPGRDGVKAIGGMVVGAIGDIEVTVDLLTEDGDLVADRIVATGVRRADGARVRWTENHFYRLDAGRIVEWWPEGGPPLG